MIVFHKERQGSSHIMNIKHCASAIVFAGFILVVCSPVSAGIVSGAVTDIGGVNDAFDEGGTFKKLVFPFIDSAPDNTVGNNNLQEPHLYALDELQSFTLVDSLAVNILADGSGGGTTTGTIAAGTTISSYYIFFDPFTNLRQAGTVTFESDILGIATIRGTLNDSDFLGNPNVTYLSPRLRGIEPNDSVTITGLRTITVDWRASSPGDSVRVLTAVPIPGTGLLLGSALVAAAWARRKQKLAS